MALVANYSGSSGEDTSEDEDVSQSQSSSSSKKPLSPSKHNLHQKAADPFFADSSDDEDSYAAGTSTIGKFLPKPKTLSDLPSELDAEDELIPPKKTYGDEEKPPPRQTSFPNLMAKKVKGVVRITAPSLKDFESDDVTDKSKSSKFTQSMIKKGSGLFAILPEPRGISSLSKDISFLKTKPPTSNSSNVTATSTSSVPSTTSSTSSASTSLPRSLIPDSVKNAGKRPPLSKLEEIKAKYMKKEANVVIVSRSGDRRPVESAKNSYQDSDDSDEDGAPDFFSFDSGANEEIDEQTLDKLKLPMPNFNPLPPPSSTTENKSVDDEYEDASASSSNITHQQDFMKYVTKKKGKAGKGAPEINFIDVKADDLRPDTTEWVKNLTDESAIPVRRGKGLGGMQKRKHQITYLAVEAKAREQELQQQWAANKANRRQTKMKYGF